MAAMMLNQRTSGFVGTPTVSKSASRTTTRTTFTIESGLSTTERNNKRSRIGKQPISVPKGVTYDLKEGSLKVKVRFLNSFKARFGKIIFASVPNGGYFAHLKPRFLREVFPYHRDDVVASPTLSLSPGVSLLSFSFERK
jgi:hypothetical protein